MPLKLVDEIGDERTARAWLAKNKDVSIDLTVRDWKGKSVGSEFRWLGALAAIADSVGLSSLSSVIGNDSVLRAAAQAQLDGLLALWHPQLTN